MDNWVIEVDKCINCDRPFEVGDYVIFDRTGKPIRCKHYGSDSDKFK